MRIIDVALVICNPEEDRGEAVASLLRCGLGPICCSNLQEARALMCQEAFRMVLCSGILSDGDFRAALREVRKSAGHVPVMVLSHIAEWDPYLKALGAGAFDFIVCAPDL